MSATQPPALETEGEQLRPPASSVRVRILGWYVALLAVALVAAVLLQRAFLLAQTGSSAEQALDQEVGELRQLAGGIDPVTGEAFGTDVVAIFDTFLSRNVPLEGEGVITYVGGSVYKTDVNGASIASLDVAADWGQVTDPERGRVEDADLGEIRYVAVPLLGGAETHVFVVSVLMESRLTAVGDAIRVGAFVYGSIFLLASALAWVAAGRILRPLTDLTETARSISDTDFSRRIAVEGDDEIAVLGRTFNLMLDRLDNAFASQRRFIDDAGHELRTPITIIRGNLEVMGDDPEERDEAVALVTDELDRMSRIVDDLLDLAKAEQPDFVEYLPMDLGEFTRDLATRAAALDERDWTVEAVDHGVIEADRHRLNQAMMNLLRNAVEHSPAGKPVHIGSRLRGDEVRMWVRDEGETISPEDRERIFERFARVGSGKRSTDGAGLGLAITAAIADAHGGSVTVAEVPGGGNEFVITIPAWPEAAPG